MNVQAYEPRLRGKTDCEHCNEPILPGDAVTKVPPLETTYTHTEKLVHVACTKQGVERWNRLNRPYQSPLLWDRADRPKWRGGERPVAVVSENGPYLHGATDRHGAPR